MNIDWNAEEYQKSFSFVPRYGLDVISLADEAKDGETAVDLGCGSGALIPALKAKGYKVIGVEPSEKMLAIAKADNPESEFINATAEDFKLKEPASLIFSNAVFHWIERERQSLLLENVSCNLKRGGALVCEFGGEGCAEAVHSTLEEIFREEGLEYRRTFYFPTIGEYAPLLEAAGLRVTYATLFDRPTWQEGERGLVDWIRMFDKAPFEGVDEERAIRIEEEAERRLRNRLFKDGRWFVDYVRIRFKAQKL